MVSHLVSQPLKGSKGISEGHSFVSHMLSPRVSETGRLRSIASLNFRCFCNSELPTDIGYTRRRSRQKGRPSKAGVATAGSALPRLMLAAASSRPSAAR